MTATPVFGEGSKDLDKNGGSRAFLVSTTQSDHLSFLFPTKGTMKVYAKAGEIINVGSSAQGVGAGTINLRAPNGNTYTSGTSLTVGLIADHDQEMAGPLPASGGYIPYTRTVQDDEVGVWEIDFVSQNNGGPTESTPDPVPSGVGWVQPTGAFIAAFDVTVMTAASVPLTGRVYTNIFLGVLGAYNVGFNGVFTILTKDGYQYTLDNNGQAGNGFSFFVNNKGFRNADGTASYQSINTVLNPNIQDPRAPDTQSDITNKIFFNTPSLDLPDVAKTPGGTTWLLNPVSSPSSDPTTLRNPLFTGTEGTAGKAGTSPLGGTFGFTINANGGYTINIDVDHDGAYNSAVDVTLTGSAITGKNAVDWDGLDGQSHKVPVGNYTANITVVLFGAEVHFPFFDVERNINGIKLTRNNGFLSPDFNIYWDDRPITGPGTPSNPIRTIAPVNSWLNGHKWGSPGSGALEFGNEKGLDTWSFISGNPISTTVNFQVQEADLEVTGINAINGGGCVGQLVNYVIPVRNNGPNSVTDSKFSFVFPPELTDISVTHAATTGASSVTTEVTGSAAYTAKLDLANGAITTFTITGKISAKPAGGTLDITAAILRGADMTDPDATNADSAVPSDPESECDSAPSGVGCNNIKTNSIAILAQPDAGPDQSVFQNDVAILKTTTQGTWAQLGALPAAATVTSPAELTTTINGLNDVGIYQFTLTNANGCMDTVAVTVVPKKIDIPNIFTPNGDGKNDTFYIPNIQLFPGTQLIIVNRWGNEVYRSNNYQNNWNGQGLSEGTYYYVINKKEITGSITTFKGWVFLKR